MIRRISIIGAGTQGSMLAFRGLAFGYFVTIYSRQASSREKASEKIFAWLKEWEAAGRLQETTPEEAMERLLIATNLSEAVFHADIVIENVPETLEIKQAVWNEIDALAPSHALLTTNSSSLKASDIGVNVRRKDKTFNLNYMTPTKDNMVEVMWNAYTSEETKFLALTFLHAQHYVPVITQKEIKGFSLNRVWRAIKKECLFLWAQGYTTPVDLDRAWMLEWGTPYGPFGLMDKVGLDIIEQIEWSYHAESQRVDDCPPKMLSDMVSQGLLGEKSGEGFYRYPNPAYEAEDFLKSDFMKPSSLG